jgi:hypothetical protein
MLPEGGFSKELKLAKANHHNRGRRGMIMGFAALGERKNPAVLFFHAMGVTGESSELVAKYLQERYFCILQTQANAYQSRHVPYSRQKQGRDRLRAGYVRDDL